jgi:cyclopropane-fatty-acyl-phospholipid synthase
MIGQNEMDYTYTFLDRIFRLSFGETGSYSGAMYEGDFSITLEAAQRRKHAFIADMLKIKPGFRVLDMGCGWGCFLEYLKEIGAHGIGVSLSRGQVYSCRKNGFDVHLMDCKKIDPESFGTFDAVASIGAFESFCSVEEWKEGRQDQVYKDFFHTVSGLLPPGGRFYMQTMTLGENKVDYDAISLRADKNSDEYYCALMMNEYPHSWLPKDVDQVIQDAGSYLKCIYRSSGRSDYIETMKQWKKRFLKFNIKKYGLFLSFIPLYIKDSMFRHRVAMLRTNANRVCFEREILNHYRLVFEKI